MAEPGIPRGRSRYTPATPIVPKDPPVAYKLEKGARAPVYESAAEGSKPEMTGGASSSGLGQTHRAAPVEPPREPSSTLKEGVPLNFAKVCPVSKGDPSYPGNGVEEEEQCCSCGEVVLLEDVERNKGYVCRGFESDGRTRCFHVVLPRVQRAGVSGSRTRMPLRPF